MRTLFGSRTLPFLLAMMTLPAAAIDEYRLDDGAKERGVGIQATGNNSFAWLTRFVVMPGRETITGIRIAFGGGPLQTNLLDGTPVSLYIWGDSNQDGDPSDAFVLGQAHGTVAGAGSNALNTYPLLTPVTLTPGYIFYAGAIVNYAGQRLAGSRDDDGTDAIPSYPPNFHSFMAGDATGAAVDPNALDQAQLPVQLTATALGTDGNWLIRANALVTGPALGIQPNPLDFGNVATGSFSGVRFVTLTSIGTSAVTVSLIDMPPGSTFHVAAGGTCPTPPFSLPPGQDCMLAYQFAPLLIGPQALLVRVVSNDLVSPHVLHLAGTGIDVPVPVFLPPDIDFGQIDIDEAMTMTVQLLNQGNGVLDAQGFIELTPPEPAFTYSTGSCGPFPFLLAPGGLCDLDITFHPQRHGAHQLILELVSNAPAAPALLNMRGVGTLFKNGFE